MKAGISFKMSALIPGQKLNLAASIPQLIVNSTPGKFTVTAPVTKALNIAAGECVMFFNNRSAIEQAITAGSEDLKAYAAENGIDITTVEGQNQIIADFLEYGIAKGEPMYKKSGEPLMVPVRFSKEDKEQFIKDHAAELLEANREALVERVGDENASDEELIAAISVDDIESPTMQSIYGSRTATTSSKTGVGLQLGFTDSNIWNQLKDNLSAEDKTKFNRYFDVDLTSPITNVFHNGEKTVEVLTFPISFREDKEATRNFGREEEE